MNGPSGSRKISVIKKDSEEFEFFLVVDESRKGQIISSVTKDGPAHRAGLKDGDRVIAINGNSVENKDHNQVVAIIRECIPTNEVNFVVVDKEHDPNVKKDNAGQDAKKKAADARPRICKVKKKNNSFGFKLEAKEGHFVKDVAKGGAADGTGLVNGDRIIAVNKTNVEKLKHAQVVELIKKAGNKVTLLVIDEESYQILKKKNVPVTEKMAKSGSTSSRNSSSSAPKQQSTKKSTKSSKQSTKQPTKSSDHKDQGKVRVVHVIKHPTKGYGFFLRSKKGADGEFVGNVEADGAAEHSGLVNDDRVVAVNGTAIEDMAHGDVIGLIKSKQSQVVLVVMDEVARKKFEEKNDFPTTDDIVHSHNHNVRTVQLTRGDSGYGMFLKMEKGSPFHIFSDVEKDGVADKAGLKNGEIVIAVEGSGVLTDSHEDCVKKIKDAGSSVEMIVGSRPTSEFLLKVGVTINKDLAKEWPTEEELKVPSLRKETKEDKKPEVAAAVAAAATAAVVEEVVDKNEGLGMKPRFCRVVREREGFGFYLKDENGHFLTNIEHEGPAYKAGILDYDRIVEINGENVEKSSHNDIVAKIRGSGDEVTFLVVNKEEDKYFKEKGIAITALLLNTDDELADDHKPRVCRVVRGGSGYGFHLTGEPGREGQFIKEVVEGGAAEEGGLREGDRIIEVNGNNVIGVSHEDVVKKITEKKDEVTFLVIDKEGESYYKVKGIKIVAALAAAEKIAENREADVERESVGRESAASSIIETEATVHQEPEKEEEEQVFEDEANDEPPVPDVVITDDIEEREQNGGEIKDIIEEKLGEDEEKRLDDVVETIVVAAAAEEIVDRIQEERNDGDIVDSASEPEEPIAAAIEDIVDDIKSGDAEVGEILQEVQDNADAASEHSRASTPPVILAAETKEDIVDMMENRDEGEDMVVLDDDDRDEVAELVMENLENREQEPDLEVLDDDTKEEVVEAIKDRIEEEEEKDELKLRQKASAALVLKEITEKVGDRDEEEPAVYSPPTPPRSPSPPPPVQKPAVVVVVQPKVVERETPRSPSPPVSPPAVILNETGEIPKSKPVVITTDQPNPPPWAKFQLKKVTRQITVGEAAPAEKKSGSEAPRQLSAVAAMRAQFESKTREANIASAKKSVQTELEEMMKQRGEANKANNNQQPFGASVKKPQQNGPTPKKNPWVGEGMTIKIIET